MGVLHAVIWLSLPARRAVIATSALGLFFLGLGVLFSCLQLRYSLRVIGDAALIERYREWAQDYLQRRVDKNVYASLIAIL